MSIFVTLLAFEGQPVLQNEAKSAILIASLLAGVLGYVLLAKNGHKGPGGQPDNNS